MADGSGRVSGRSGKTRRQRRSNQPVLQLASGMVMMVEFSIDWTMYVTGFKAGVRVTKGYCGCHLAVSLKKVYQAQHLSECWPK